MPTQTLSSVSITLLIESCANFPKVFTGLGLLYTVNPDPQRPTCIWVNSDDGADQIQNFDAYTGGACGQGPIRVLASSVVVPTSLCTPTSWTSLQVTSPAASTYTSGTVAFEDSDANPLSGVAGQTLDATGTTSLSGLNLASGIGLPQFLITLVGEQGTPSNVVVVLTWTASSDPSCVKTGTAISSSGTVVGLGDSVAAGHGLGGSGGNGDNPYAYPVLLAKSLGDAPDDLAISGACAAKRNDKGADLNTPVSDSSGQHCTNSVFEEINSMPKNLGSSSRIVVTVGADDVEFSTCLKALLTGIGNGLSNPLCQGPAYQARLAALRHNLGLDITKIRSLAPNTPIVLVGYYNPISGDASSGLCRTLFDAAAIWENRGDPYGISTIPGQINSYLYEASHECYK